MNQNWSVIIFTYNEEETIASVIQHASDFLKQDDHGSHEIIIVDDGSDDKSENIISELVNLNNDLKYIRHSKNSGIGPALLSGYKNAVKENVIAIPGDGQFDINELNKYRNFPPDTFLSFYRNEMVEYNLFRKAVNKANKFFNKLLLDTDIKDINWVKAYKTRELMNLDLKLKSALVSSEIGAKFYAKGYKVIDILSVYHKRVAGTPRGASFKTLTSAAKELLKLAVLMRKFKKSLKITSN